jgi:polyphosphate kinase
MIDIQLMDNTKAREINGPVQNKYRKTKIRIPYRTQMDTYNYLKNKI